MSSDYYSILGVTPATEDVVIRAAYRALMRHYHPDTNPDPEAQRRAREITSAFAVLRDPARRAQYDSGRAGTDLAIIEEFPFERRPPAMRGLGMASAALAFALVAALWVLPQPTPPTDPSVPAPVAKPSPKARTEPITELEPESERLARLRSVVIAPPMPELVTPVDQAGSAEASFGPALAATPVPTQPVHMAAHTVRHAVAERPRSTPVAPQPKEDELADCRPGGSLGVSVGCKNDRLVALDRMAAGFFSQSMAHADAAKKAELLSSHTRSAASRSACRSDSCVSDAYLRQMREISAIMEGREPPAQ